MSEVFGIILKSDSEICCQKIYGRTVYEWVRSALGANSSVFVPYNEDKSVEFGFLPLVREALNPSCEYTAVLYADTPLLTSSTLSDAVSELVATKGNVLMLTRGFIFKTDYLKSCEKLYSPPHFYCEEEDFLTVSDYVQLSLVSDIMRIRILKHHMKNGVFVRDSATTFIDADVCIGEGVEIHPFNVIKNESVIGSGTVLYEGNVIDDATVGDKCSVGPYARLRPGTRLGRGVKVGNFVELKNSSVGERTKIMHLAYCGDAQIGRGCNIGCGVVVANYDGVKKHPTLIGDNVFVGSNSNLVAPLTLSDGCFVAAGSTITQSVPPDMLAIARARQENKQRKPKE